MTAELEQALLDSMHDDPADVGPWRALHDLLLDADDPRLDFVRWQMLLRGETVGQPQEEVEQRVRRLIEEGHRPCVPVLTNSIGMRLALIPAGTFLMGSPEDEEGHSGDEGPQHEVEITRPFY